MFALLLDDEFLLLNSLFVVCIVLKQEQEHAQLSEAMMTKKTKRLYERMQHGISKKQDIIDTLVEKRTQAESVPEPAQKANKKRSNSASSAAAVTSAVPSAVPTRKSLPRQASAPAVVEAPVVQPAKKARGKK